MGKRRRPVQSSSEQLLSSAASQISTKQGKSEIKKLIVSTDSSSDLVSSLPTALHQSVCYALESYKEFIKSRDTLNATSSKNFKSSPSPALKKIRRSSRLKRSDEAVEPLSSAFETLDIQKKLQSYAFISHICISHPRRLFSPSDLLVTVQLLHDSLVLYDDPSVIVEVANLCEAWWKDSFPERETLITQSFPFLLSKSLTRGKKTDVYRIYSLREAFTLFDYEDESIVDLRLLLVRCVITPVYLKTKEGRNFISFVVGLNDLLLKEVLELIKSQIPYGKKSVLEAYAEIIFKAWRGSNDSTKVEIEDEFLQGLIEGAIHAQKKSFAASIRRVLNGFIEQRTTSGVDKVLFRLAEPVLFRSLQVANSNVRENALFLLLHLFPLEDPDVTKDVKDALLEKQFFLLQKLLVDDCPEIRGVAVEGACRILNLFWEVIPSLTITKALAMIFDDMACDACNEVRLSTLKGIIYLLENPQCHEIMKVLLPKLNGILCDPSLSVRIAAADLLLEVGLIRPFQFNKVVSLDSLFFSLANDHEHVARRLTRLLIPSYFPSNLNPLEACNRFSTLMRRSPLTAARFCEYALSEGSSSKSLIELLRSSVSLALEEISQSSDLTDGLIIASDNLCSCIAAEKSGEALTELFSADKIKRLLHAATSSKAIASVLNIASIVSPNDLLGLRDHCLLWVEDCIGLSDNVEKHCLMQKIYSLFFSCDWFSDLLGMMISILQSISSRFLAKFRLDVPAEVSQCIKKKINLSVKSTSWFDGFTSKVSIKSDMLKVEKDLCLAAGIAWQLKDLIADADMQNALFRFPHFKVAFFSLKIISQISIEVCLNCKSFDTSPIAALTSLLVYLSLRKDGTAVNKVLNSDAEDGSFMDSLEQRNILNNTLNDLLHSAEKILDKNEFVGFVTPSSKTEQDMEISKSVRSRRRAATASASNRSGGSEFKLDMPKAKCIENVMKMCTSILKFIADTKTMNLVGQNDISYLRFASAYARYVLSSLGDYRLKVSYFKEDDLKEAFHYLKTSFTYAAKLLHLVLQQSNEFSTVPVEAFYLSNELLNLITAIEPYFGAKLAFQILSVVKPWLPVLILGVGCNQLIKSRKQEGESKFIGPSWHHFPTWLAALSKAELHEINTTNAEENSDEIAEPEGTLFTKVILMVMAMLKKGSLRIVDAFGCVILVGLDVGLDTKDFDLLLGLVHFICEKLLGKEFTSWNELEQMTAYLQEIYPRLEAEIANPSISEEDINKLETAKTLLTSLWLNRE